MSLRPLLGFAAAGLVSIAAVGCGGSSPAKYPAESVSSFTAACVPAARRAGATVAAAAARCACVIEELEKHVPFEQFSAYNASAMLPGAKVPASWDRYIEACQRQDP